MLVDIILPEQGCPVSFNKIMILILILIVTMIPLMIFGERRDTL